MQPSGEVKTGRARGYSHAPTRGVKQIAELKLGGLSDRPVSGQPNRANAVDITELCRGQSKA